MHDDRKILVHGRASRHVEIINDELHSFHVSPLARAGYGPDLNLYCMVWLNVSRMHCTLTAGDALLSETDTYAWRTPLTLSNQGNDFKLLIPWPYRRS
jgi:hypothetical protein